MSTAIPDSFSHMLVEDNLEEEQEEKEEEDIYKTNILCRSRPFCLRLSVMGEESRMRQDSSNDELSRLIISLNRQKFTHLTDYNLQLAHHMGEQNQKQQKFNYQHLH